MRASVAEILANHLTMSLVRASGVVRAEAATGHPKPFAAYNRDRSYRGAAASASSWSCSRSVCLSRVSDKGGAGQIS